MRSSLLSSAIVAVTLAFGSAACSAQDEPASDDAATETGADAGAPTNNSADDAAGGGDESAADEADGDGDADAGSDIDAEADADADTGDESDEAANGDAGDDAAETDAAAVEDERITAEARAEYAALTGDAAAGARVFRQCMACHSVQEGQNRVGPSLHGVIGREAGTVEGFRYSSANRESHINWTEEALFVYLENPRQFIPRTTMAFVGVRDAQQRADLIAYLRDNTQ